MGNFRTFAANNVQSMKKNSLIKLGLCALILSGMAVWNGMKSNDSAEDGQKEEFLQNGAQNGVQGMVLEGGRKTQNGAQNGYNPKGINTGVEEVTARLMEVPETHEGELIIHRENYTMSFNTTTNCPNWVAWELTREEAKAQADRPDEFFPDRDIPAASRVTTRDYSGSGYDRGHMCPAGDNKYSTKAMNQCFYMSNMCPQDHELNTGAWEKLESSCRYWARHEGKIYIVTGPVFNDDRKIKTIGREHKVRVPNGFFKVVLSTRKGQEKAIGFYYANNDSYQTMRSAAMSVDAIEKMTGYNFFVNLEDRLEDRVERSYNFSAWK